MLTKQLVRLLQSGNRCHRNFYIPTMLPTILSPKINFSMAKISKKDQEKINDKNEKKERKSSLGDATTIDLNKYEALFMKIIDKYQSQINKLKLGRLESEFFSTIFVKVDGETHSITDLAQVTSKNMNTCVVSPYASEHLQLIDKVLKSTDQGLQVSIVDKNLSVYLPSTSLKQLKIKLIAKLQKLTLDRKEELKKQRSKSLDDLKKYKAIMPADRYKVAEQDLKKLFEKHAVKLQKIEKEKEKQLQK